MDSDIGAKFESRMDCIQKLIEVELEFYRSTGQVKELSIFRRNSATWEMLMILAHAYGRREIGLFELVEEVQSSSLGMSAKLNFLRDRREDGLLLFKQQENKRNKWNIELAPKTREELFAAIHRRNRAYENIVRTCAASFSEVSIPRASAQGARR